MVRDKTTYDDVLKQHLKILKELQYESGLFAASRKNSATGYNKSWLRDNFYECLAFVVLKDWDIVDKTYSALLDVFLKHEYKIDCVIAKKPQFRHEYIHARINPVTFDEFWEDWGNKQNDSIGAILYMIGELEHVHKKSVLKNENHLRITNKLVKYLNGVEYWQDSDSGMWEENEEVHASSVGACVAGLKSIKRVKGVNVENELISKGEKTLNNILPRESKSKFVDLSLLSLIYPYAVVTDKQREEILRNVEYLLLREKGVIRYKNDHYYNKNPDGYSEEAEWTFGLSWLAIIYEHLGNMKKAKFFIDKMLNTQTNKGIPELYFSNSNIFNENTPLGWSESLFIVAIHDMNKKLLEKEENND